MIRECELYRQMWELQKLGDGNIDYLNAVLTPGRKNESALPCEVSGTKFGAAPEGNLFETAESASI